LDLSFFLRYVIDIQVVTLQAIHPTVKRTRAERVRYFVVHPALPLIPRDLLAGDGFLIAAEGLFFVRHASPP
jgi:hypothetical protein